MKKSGKLLTLTKLGMGLVLILCVSLATFFMASCEMITVVINGKFIDENGSLILTYSNGDEEVIGHVKGVRGLHGCAAPDGQGIVEAKTDDLDQFVVVYSDGVTDEFGRVDESDDMPDSYADRVRINSITRDGDKMTIHYLRGEEAVVDIDCDYKCRFKSELKDIAADMIKDEVRQHKKDECGIYVIECPDCDGNIRRSVFHGIYHRELVDYYEVEEGKNPCIDGGNLYKKCTVCGELLGEPVKVEPEGHKWGPWTVKTNPTYEAEGELERECTVCHNLDAEIKKIPAIDDEHYSCEVTKPKDGCTDATGEADYSCCIDGQEFTFHLNLPAIDHQTPEKDAIDTDVEPDCLTPGKGHGPCPVCGKNVEVSIPALGHEYVRQEHVVYDGDSKGHFVEICSRCDVSRNVDIVGGEWFWIGEITCGDDWESGFEQYKYIADDGTEYITDKLPILEKPEHVIKDAQGVKIDIAEIAKLDKDNKVITVEDAESGEQIAVIDLGKAGKRGIEVVEFADQKADCKDGSYGRGYIRCSQCQGYLLFATYKNHPGYEDKPQGWEIKAATCTEDGYERYVCPDCGFKKVIVLKAPGHKPQYDELIKVTNDDGTFTFTAKSHCSVCNEALPDKTNLKLVVDGVGDIIKSSKVITEPDCTNKGTLEVTYKYTDPDHSYASVTLTETEEIEPVSGAHLIKLTTGKKVHLKEVAVKFDEESGLYVLNIDDNRFEEGMLQEFADQKASCNEDGTPVYGRGYYTCPECGGAVLILTYKDHS